MLRELSIRNFAIIDDLTISFAGGLTILSGETGAGKSIIIHAVNLLLGSRASAKMVRTGESAAELEALFDIDPGSRIAQIMEQLGHDATEGLIVRRIISHTNRHRIYINGRLGTMAALTAITANLASISGQHAHQGLLKDDEQLLILDHYAGLIDQRRQLAELYHQLQPLLRKLNKLVRAKQDQADRLELLEFQKKEIETAAVEPEEDEKLQQERQVLKNSETLFESVHEAIETVYSAPGAVVEKLTSISRQLEKNGQIDQQLAPLAALLQEATIQLEDIAGELRTYLQQVQTDDSRLDAVEQRLDALQKLKRKYGGSIEAIQAHLDTVTQQLQQTLNLDDEIEQAREAVDHVGRQLQRCACELSDRRRQAAATLARDIEQTLGQLKMGQTRFEIELIQRPADKQSNPALTVNGHVIAETGLDQARFMIAANVGEALKPLAAIASGGELSRTVLAIKAILAHRDTVKTVVFDEVDAGIGGGVAEVVGRKLAELADHHQIICITHLPQIARHGDHHFQIVKSVAKGRTTTHIRPVTGKRRVDEIARMLDGETLTPTAREHARKLLDGK